MPFYAHRLDLPEAYQAADRIGRLVMVGKLDWPDVDRYAHRWAIMAHKATGVAALGAETRFCWAAGDAVTQAEHERADVERAIKVMLRPLIAERVPWNGLMAEAHEINGANGFLLAEAEVSEIVRTEIYFALPPAPRGRHG